MSKQSLVEIKYFEPAVANRHPARYRYANAWMEVKEEISYCCLVGGQGWFPFPSGKCDCFLGEFQAEIIGEISRDRLMEKDRFVEEIS